MATIFTPGWSKGVDGHSWSFSIWVNYGVGRSWTSFDDNWKATNISISPGVCGVLLFFTFTVQTALVEIILHCHREKLEVLIVGKKKYSSKCGGFDLETEGVHCSTFFFHNSILEDLKPFLSFYPHLANPDK